MLCEAALCCTIEACLQRLRELLRKPECDERSAVSRLLNSLPVCSRVLRAQATMDVTFLPMVFYERSRMGATRGGFFFEGLGARLQIADKPVGVQISEQALKNLANDALADRRLSVRTLEKIGFDKIEPQSSDLSGTPLKVQGFVARERALFAGLRRIRPCEFATCQNCECGRVFFVGRGPHAGSDASFLTLVAGSAAKAPQTRFCTSNCYRQWLFQLDSALPRIDAIMEDEVCRKQGRARVAEALRQVFKRNEIASRTLRVLNKKPPLLPAVSSEDFKREREKRVKMLNVDMALVFAASLLAESHVLANGKVLPASFQDWRQKPLFFAKSIKIVCGLYDKLKCREIVYNPLLEERFLEKIKCKAKHIF
jgi:hypothetical protein